MYHRDFALKDVPRPKKERKLPVVLSRDEVLRITQTIQNPKHWLMIELMCAAGLRVSEIVKVRVQDVNLEELTLFVRGCKGEKDRLTVFSESLKDALRRQMEGKESKDLVFSSERGAMLTPRRCKRYSTQPSRHQVCRSTPLVIRCAIPLLPICWSPASTFAIYRIFWDMPDWRPPASIPRCAIPIC